MHDSRFVHELLPQLGQIVVLTGAGISTASGIPAYRDRDGRWQHSRPVMHQNFVTLSATRRRYWARSYVGWPLMANAIPNAGHEALVTLEAMGRISMLLTQNVDGLHQKAGSVSVIELHGGIRQVRCIGCHELFPRSTVQEWLVRENPNFDQHQMVTLTVAPDGDAKVLDDAYADFQVPDCPRCAGILKPDVVFYGDSVPRERVEAATRAISEAAALLVVGSTLMVYSSYRFAEMAHRLGKPIIAINQGMTRADSLLTRKIEADCSVVLTDWVNAQRCQATEGWSL
jgi:NAD-dependent SIR2 family protein deacetylase